MEALDDHQLQRQLHDVFCEEWYSMWYTPRMIEASDAEYHRARHNAWIKLLREKRLGLRAKWDRKLCRYEYTITHPHKWMLARMRYGI